MSEQLYWIIRPEAGWGGRRGPYTKARAERLVEVYGWERAYLHPVESLEPLPPEEWECNRYRAGVVGGGAFGANKVSNERQAMGL